MAQFNPTKIVSICGSLRAKSFNAALQRALPGLAPAGMSIKAGPRLDDLPLYNADVQEGGFPRPVLDLASAIRGAGGVILVTPEYNYSVSGVLKNAIDWVSRLPDQPLFEKPVLIQSVSTSLLGGVRAQGHLRQILVYIEARTFNKPEVMVASARQKFDPQTNELVDRATRELVREQLAAFADFVATMPPQKRQEAA